MHFTLVPAIIYYFTLSFHNNVGHKIHLCRSTEPDFTVIISLGKKKRKISSVFLLGIRASEKNDRFQLYFYKNTINTLFYILRRLPAVNKPFSMKFIALFTLRSNSCIPYRLNLVPSQTRSTDFAVIMAVRS